MSQFGLSEAIFSKIIDVFKVYSNIDEVILYGSRAMGNYRNGSDIDITIKGKDINLHFLNTISLELDNLNLPYKIDISSYHYIENIELLDHIKRVGILLYKS